MTKSLYILDGHYQIYRSFYAPFRVLTSPTGEPTRATHVFWQMLLNLIRSRRPDFLAVTLDAGDETTFRREMDPNYKANREPQPEGLSIQADRIVSILSAVGIPIYELVGYEADDLMATIAEQLRDQDIEVFLVSRDKDLEQLLSDRVRMFDPTKDEVIDPEALLEKKGYTPRQAVEIQTLTGDSTDNVPGVPGIGIKTATKLINEHDTADAVVKNADSLTPKMRERVLGFADKLDLTRKLVTLKRDVPMTFDLSDCRVSALNFAAARPIFAELGFNRLTEQLEAFGGAAPEAPAPTVTPAAKVTSEPGKYHLIDTPEALEDFAKRLYARRVFAFDTETTGLNPVSADLVGLSFSWQSGEGYYLPVRAGLNAALPVQLVVDRLKSIFEDPAVGKVGQNLKYDVLALRQVVDRMLKGIITPVINRYPDLKPPEK